MPRVAIIEGGFMKTPIEFPDLKLEYRDYRDNLIVDKNNPILIQKAWRDHFAGGSFFKEDKNGGKAYLGVPNSEDALTWNVFRSLQKESPEGLELIANVFGLSPIEKILFWGCDVESRGDEQQFLNTLIRATDGQLKGTMTEPDIVLIAESEVAFVECKLNLGGNTSPWIARGSHKASDKPTGPEKRLAVYKKVGFREFEGLTDWQDYYQLIRNYVYARLLANAVEKKPVLIPLINGDHKATLEQYFKKAFAGPLGESGVLRKMRTWQDIQTAISSSGLLCRAELFKKFEEALRASRNKGFKED